MNQATAFDRIRDALLTAGKQVKDKASTAGGNRQCQAQCPAHDDHNPSLSLRDNRGDGSVLICCHAGCNTEDVLDALGLTKRDMYDNPRSTEYCYPDGRIVHRTWNPDTQEFKRFRQSGNTKGTRLYRDVTDAVKAGRTIYVVEGEKDVHALESLGAVATTSPMGASNAHKADWSPLTGANVVIVADKDKAGDSYAHQVTQQLDRITRSTVTVHAKTGKDAADHVAASHGVDEFQPIDNQPVHDVGGTETKEPKKSAPTVITEIACEWYIFGISDAGEPYAVPKVGPRVVRMLRGGKTSLRGQLAREYYVQTGKTAPQQALSDALLVIEGMAQEAEEARLYPRVARQDDEILLDLGDRTGRTVRITGNGWTVTEDVPLLFKRTALTGPLPEPERGGTLDELWKWLNVAEQDRSLVAAWLVSVLFCDVPHPVLGLFGEQGTGKTTAEKVLVLMLDPGPVPVRKPPRDAESWVTGASASWVVGLDNLSDMPVWLSDSICRAVTGEGDIRRKLYTDGELAVFTVRRCLIVNGIDLGALRGDLADRMLPIELHRIDETERLDEEELWPAWAAAHPRILGAVLDLAAGVLNALPSVRLKRKPRMADFARIMAAVDQVLDTDAADRYLVKQKAMATDSLTGDVFVTAISEAISETFTGTAAELLGRLTPADEKWRAPKGWPTTPRLVTQRLRRQAPPMRKAGWTVTDDEGANHDKVVRWTIAAPAPTQARESGKSDPQHPPDPPQGDEQCERPPTLRVNAGHERGSARVSDAFDPHADPRHPHADPHQTNNETAGPGTTAGLAGVAGQESPLSRNHDEPGCCKGGLLVLACKLCQQSPTYHRRQAS